MDVTELTSNKLVAKVEQGNCLHKGLAKKAQHDQL